jgi:signal transduction histidine kinase
MVSLWSYLTKFFASIRTKIVLPYFLLTVVVAGIGVFIVTNLVISTLEERIANQLVDSGRIVSESMVAFEESRLAVLRAITFTQGVPQAVQEPSAEQLAQLIPQIVANSTVQFVSVLDQNGQEIYAFDQSQTPAEELLNPGRVYANLTEINLTLQGVEDQQGDKRAFVAQVGERFFLLTIGPVYVDNEVVGAVLVGQDVEVIARELNNRAVARITLYDRTGRVLATTLGGGQAQALQTLTENEQTYNTVIQQLAESADQYQLVNQNAERLVALRQIELLGQQYQLAFGVWQLRGESIGLFSVALPTDFILSSAVASRDNTTTFFIILTLVVLVIGFLIAQRIISPLYQLVDVSTSVAQGNLNQRTGLKRTDEIGELAHSFDIMTNHLVERTSNMEAILNSIADGVMVFDSQNQLINHNATAQAVLDYTQTPTPLTKPEAHSSEAQQALFELLTSAPDGVPQRHELGDRVYSTLSAAVTTPAGDSLGRVVVLRDVTRESEADRVKDNFITSVSHELRTPLTAIMGSVNLLLMMNAQQENPQLKQLLTMAKNNTDTLTAQVNRLIEISEIQAGHLQLHPQPINFVTVVEEVVGEWREKMKDKPLTFTYQSLPTHLPMQGDAPRLKWAINNLLQNAYDYTAVNGRVNLEVELIGEHWLQLSVRDTGIGLREADQRYLFTRFFRVDNPPPFDLRGIGLGLFIAKYIVEGHQGQIFATSTFGEGSCFSFTLPLATRPVVNKVQDKVHVA